MTTLDLVLRAARAALITTLALEPEVAALEAAVLLGQVLNQSRAYLLAHPEMELDDASLTPFATLLQRRLHGEPIAYLLGQREFYGFEFSVTPDVLIPRPETELLVELALERIPPDQALQVLDLGTGSGAIALSIAKLRPQAQITAVDCAPGALSIARHNALRLGCTSIKILESDWFSALDITHPFDLIVSNPPYIAIGDPHLTRGDVKSEPALALLGGIEGLDAIRHIVFKARSYLRDSGCLLFEHGYDQGAACREILHSHGWQQIASYADLSGWDRVSGGTR